jgi:tRNA(Ile)-lysidine synthase
VKVRIHPEKYVVAVSGGVDSMALLDLLTKQRGLELVVAHFNHGIRPDSETDEEFVRQAAERYKLPYEAGLGKLTADSSEAQARSARYKFLDQIKQKYQAQAIITAHHQDDLLETAILNLMRGTGRRGLTAISQNPDIIRPLLSFSKANILNYARKVKLEWREDPTNQDERFLRNFIRRRIVPKLNKIQRRQFLSEIHHLSPKNQIINQEIEKLSQYLVKDQSLERGGFIALPSEVASEVLMNFLRQNHIRDFDKKTTERLVIAVKTAKPGTKHDVNRGVKLEITPKTAFLAKVSIR